jgi:hypothetical protein
MNVELIDLQNRELDIEEKILEKVPFEEVFNSPFLVRDVRSISKVLK